MPTPLQTLVQTLTDAQSLMADWIVPEGASDEHTLGELLGVLDNRTLAAAQAALSGPFHQGINQSLLDARHKIALDLLRKYGVLVDPESLSDETVRRLQDRVNYPRTYAGITLKQWSDLVFGAGEMVQLYLPQSPGRNTHLSTVQFLSGEATGFIKELVRSVQVEEDQQVLSDQEDEHDDIPLFDPAHAPRDTFDVEIKAITAGSFRGINTLHALQEEALDKKWSPALQNCIQAILNSHTREDEIDTLDAMVELMERVNTLAEQARKIIGAKV